MKVTLENTSKMVEINGVPTRIWEGHTESGKEVHAFICRIAVGEGEDQKEFLADLQATTKPPSKAIEAYPMRLLI